MIEGKKISKSFGNLTLFSEFNFKIDNGEFICFSGESGAGKTTLLNIIGLLEPIDNGQLLINGIEYKSNRQKLTFYQSEVGFLFQNFALIENKTVEENLEIVSPKSRTDYTIKQTLEAVGLEKKLVKRYTHSPVENSNELR